MIPEQPKVLMLRFWAQPVQLLAVRKQEPEKEQKPVLSELLMVKLKVLKCFWMQNPQKDREPDQQTLHLQGTGIDV